jgi:hypothetical protein
MADRWSVSSDVTLLVACRRSAVFCIFICAQSGGSNRVLPTCERSASFGATPAVLLRCSEWQATRRMYLCWEGRCSSVVEQVLGAVP